MKPILVLFGVAPIFLPTDWSFVLSSCPDILNLKIYKDSEDI